MSRRAWEMLSEGAEKWPDVVAVWVSGQAMTYREFKRAAGLFGHALCLEGLRPGDRIALWSPNTLEAIVTFFAAAYAGAIVVPLNDRYTSREASDALGRFVPKVLVVADKSGTNNLLGMAAHWLQTQRERPRPQPHLWTIGDASPEVLGTSARSLSRFIVSALQTAIEDDDGDVWSSAPPAALDPDFIIQMTSGSTAAPKAVLLTQSQCVRMGYELGVRYDLHEGDRYFVCNPIHHVGCSNFGLMAALTHGAGFYTLREFDGNAAVIALQQQNCTHHHGIAAHYLYEMASPILKPGSTSLRIVVASGALASQVQAAYGPVTTVSCYGSSETTASPFCSDFRASLKVRVDTAGTALPGVEAAIIDPRTSEPVEAGQVGELLIRGWCVMRGYYADAGETARAIDGNGWYHTGDMASIDGEGSLRFFSRIKEFLKVGGENVAAMDVEAVLQSHPLVRNAAVIALPHELLGEVPVAVIVGPASGPSPTEADLVRYCSSRLAKFKVPRRIYMLSLDDLPMTGPGKVNKRELLRRITAGSLGSDGPGMAAGTAD